jgi:hypothetical protein
LKWLPCHCPCCPAIIATVDMVAHDIALFVGW